LDPVCLESESPVVAIISTTVIMPAVISGREVVKVHNVEVLPTAGQQQIVQKSRIENASIILVEKPVIGQATQNHLGIWISRLDRGVSIA